MTKERLAAFSDGVFAVIITIMVLQLKLPDQPTFGSLLEEWPTGLSYAVSYFLIAIMWINHHFLLRFAEKLTPRLMFTNFAHMFCASLVPFATAWVAASKMAAVPVFIYAAVVVMVNITYHAIAYDVVPRTVVEHEPKGMRHRALVRSSLTLGLFVIAMFLALKAPLVAFLLVTCILLTYAHPETPGEV